LGFRFRTRVWAYVGFGVLNKGLIYRYISVHIGTYRLGLTLEEERRVCVKWTRRNAHMYRYVPICTNIYRYLPICTDMYRYVPICNDIYRYLPIFTDIYRYVPIFTDMYQYVTIFTDIYRYLPIFTDMYRYVPIYRWTRRNAHIAEM